jgi:hypothetical protein
MSDEEALLSALAAQVLTPSSLPPEEKRRRLVELVVNSDYGTCHPSFLSSLMDWTQQAVALWLEAMPIKEGPVLGKVNKGGRFVGAGMSAPSIYSMVVEYAELLGVEFRPHDLRRTYGKLAHKGGAKIEQIQLSYGHASLTTTERYLGIEQDLEDAPCDHLGLTTT